MTTSELRHEGSVAATTASPEGVESAYGDVEIVWYPDRVTIAVPGAGRLSRTGTYLSGDGEDILVEIRLPELDELLETLPGAD